MRPIVIALKEVKGALIQINASEMIIDALIVFSSAYLLCLLFLAPPAVAAIPFALALVYGWSHKVANVHAREVEETVPILKDQLTTVSDNLYRENEIITGLQQDVLALLRHVRVSYFIDFKRIWREIMILAVLSFAILIVATLNVHFADYKSVAKEIGDVLGEGGLGGLDPDGSGEGGSENFTDIFGNETLVELGENELNLQINPVLSEINIEDIQEAKEREFEESVFPTEIIARTDSSFDDKIPKENREIVKKYFSGITQAR